MDDSKKTQGKGDNPLTTDMTKQAAKLEGLTDAQMKKRKIGGKLRVNWDREPFRSRRKRFADSWTNKNDLFRCGDSFGKFCKVNNIDRRVLRRYLAGKYKKEQETDKNEQETGQQSTDKRTKDNNDPIQYKKEQETGQHSTTKNELLARWLSNNYSTVRAYDQKRRESNK